MKRKNKKLCIIGSAPSKADAPYSDPSFDIWAISGAVFSQSVISGKPVQDTEDNGWNTVHRYDALFEMHKRPIFAPKLSRLALCGKPVVMQRKVRDISTSEAYPADEIAEALGDEFFCSIAYMLAYAIYLGYEEIRLYGIILLHETEYMYYLGVARAKGIKVWAPDDTQLTTSAWRYGYDDQDAVCAIIEARRRSLDEDIKKQEQVITDARAAFFQLRGASIDCQEVISLIKGGLA
jgi:hypothetical protein